jgi:predicted metal-dependent hydrolase
VGDSARDTLLAAARAFNSGHYFEAHEILEEALEDTPDAEWDLYVGLVQIAVGYHKTTQQLWTGAAGMLARGLAKLAPYPSDAGGVQLEALRRRVAADIAALRGGTFDPAAFPADPVRLQLTKKR